MKHDLEAFSRDMVTLIKKSGDSGDSGDKSKKSLGERANFVPTRCAGVSPLDSEWGHGVAASGDRKEQDLQMVGQSVPTVPTATTNFAEAEDHGEHAGRRPNGMQFWQSSNAVLARIGCRQIDGMTRSGMPRTS